MCPVGTQSIWTIWKSSTPLADGREIVYFDEEPGPRRDPVAAHRPPPAADARPAATVRPAGLGDPLGPAGRGVGGDRGGAPGPDGPAPRRPMPARTRRGGGGH